MSRETFLARVRQAAAAGRAYRAHAQPGITPEMGRASHGADLVAEFVAEVTKAGGSPVVVRRPDTGVMVPPGDVNALAAAIRSLASDALARARYGERGRAFAATRTWAAHGQRSREASASPAGAA